MRWHLPTCECIAEYHFNNGTLIFESMFRRCVAHQSMASDTDVWNCINTEHDQGSNSNNIILDNAPSSMIDTNVDGIKTLKKNIIVQWSWTGVIPNRVLNIAVSGISLTTNQKNSIQAKLNERFGISNVVIL